MVVGVDRFREYFRDFQGSYVLIGGVAASIAMEELGEEFRLTKDLDIVLVVEALDRAFVGQFWKFIKEVAMPFARMVTAMGTPRFFIASRIRRTNPFPFRSSCFPVSRMAWSTKKRPE